MKPSLGSQPETVVAALPSLVDPPLELEPSIAEAVSSLSLKVLLLLPFFSLFFSYVLSFSFLCFLPVSFFNSYSVYVTTSYELYAESSLGCIVLGFCIF